MFKLVAEAYATLSDPQRRAAYDLYGRDSVRFEGGEDGGGGGGFAGTSRSTHTTDENGRRDIGSASCKDR
jgi:DnaJ-class molecular chaperone